MSHLVKYHNNINKLKLGKFTDRETDIFFSIMFKSKGTTGNVIIEFNELKNLIEGHRSEQRLVDNIRRLNLKLKTLVDEIVDIDGNYTAFNLFGDITTKPKDKVVEIKIDDRFRNLINNIIKNFTEFDLKDLISLNSTYSKTIFRLLKQWETKKIRKFTIEEFREILGVPEKYRMSEIDKKILNPIMQELPQYFSNLKLEKIKTGKKVTSLKFTWSRKIEKIESPQNDDLIDIIEISDKLNKSIEKVKKNRFIAPLLTIDNIEILVQMFQEKDLIKGLNWSYIEIKQEIKSLNYLIKSIKTGMEQKEKKLVVKTVPKVVQEQETKEEIIKENNLGLEKAEELKITKDEYEDLYKKFLEEQKTEHNLLTRKGFDIANKNKYEIIEKANNIMKIENEISKITITKEKYELLYQNFIILNDCID
ncbi:MAG: replication initiation protein, partial [Cetobacterium sp.]